MIAAATQDWNPGSHQCFRGLRLCPALDLWAQVPEELPAGDMVDPGCGIGAVVGALAARFPHRSTAMRPFLDRLDPEEAGHFTATYAAALARVYPSEPDGAVWFPFKRGVSC